jgi:hypothetical protein
MLLYFQKSQKQNSLSSSGQRTDTSEHNSTPRGDLVQDAFAESLYHTPEKSEMEHSLATFEPPKFGESTQAVSPPVKQQLSPAIEEGSPQKEH